MPNAPIKSRTIPFKTIRARAEYDYTHKKQTGGSGQYARTKLRVEPNPTKGFEFDKGRYVIMSDEDLEKVRPESTRVIDLVQFTDAAAIDPIYFERPYYLAPDGQMALAS